MSCLSLLSTRTVWAQVINLVQDHLTYMGAGQDLLALADESSSEDEEREQLQSPYLEPAVWACLQGCPGETPSGFLQLLGEALPLVQGAGLARLGSRAVRCQRTFGGTVGAVDHCHRCDWAPAPAVIGPLSAAGLSHCRGYIAPSCRCSSQPWRTSYL